jgi:hypothetical protein
VPGFEDHLHLEGLDVGVLHHDIDEVSVEVLALPDLGDGRHGHLEGVVERLLEDLIERVEVVLDGAVGDVGLRGQRPVGQLGESLPCHQSHSGEDQRLPPFSIRDLPPWWRSQVDSFCCPERPG